jgi:hypothetical protein
LGSADLPGWALDIVGYFVQSALMSEAASAARFGVALKVLGATFYWVSGFAPVIAFIANRQYRFDPFLKFGPTRDRGPNW